MTAPGPARTAVTAGDVRGLVVGDGNVVHQHFLGGITRLPTDYAQRVGNFLVEYLGTPGRPVPFGGRQRETGLLDAWLADPGAPPCLLLCAAAGQGKSALLVRWSRALLDRGEAVAFVPASIRYRTNLAGVFFPALAARLAGLHGDEAPLDSHAPAEVWRGVVADYLARPLPDGRRLLVVLDGLDEAADWEAGADLLPAAPPPGLRVVVSARTTAAAPTGGDWLRTLGLDGPGRAASLPLAGLTEDDVLRLVGAEAPGPAGQLHRLSGGDPLLLSLYLRDGRPEDLTGLAATPPGLAGYFDRWWAEQRHQWRDWYGAFEALEVERRVGALMALFSRAAGPLDRDDLTGLDPQSPPHAVASALVPLTRFLLGDGRTYALAHSRLGEYWAERHLGAAESRRLDRRFAAYGLALARELGEGGLAPAEVSPYVVQYLSAHLDRIAAGPEDRLPLVHERWRQAWQHVEGTDSGFLADVRACRRTLGEANGRAVAEGRAAPYLAEEVRCVLTENSVVDQSRNLSPALLSALVERGLWSAAQALAHARRLPDPDARSRALLSVAERLPEGQRREVCGEAIAAAVGEKAFGREALLGDVLPWAARLGAAPEAWEVARRHRHGPVLRTVLPRLAPHVDDALRREVRRWLEEHIEILADFENTLDVTGRHSGDTLLLAGCAPYLTEDRRRALERRLSDGEGFPFGFRFRTRLPEAGETASRAAVEEASQAFARAIAFDTGGTDGPVRSADRADALVALGPWLPDRLHGRLVDAVTALPRPWPRTDAVAGVLPHVRGEPRERLLAAVELLPFHLMRCKAFLAAADSEQHSGHRARYALRALDEARASGSEAHWLAVLVQEGDALPDSVLPGLVATAAASEDSTTALGSLTAVHLRRGRVRDALAVAARVAEPAERPWLLLPHCGLLPASCLRDLARHVERLAGGAELWWLVSRVRRLTADLPSEVVDPACAALLARDGPALGGTAFALLLARRTPGTPLPSGLLAKARSVGAGSSADEEQQEGALVGLVRAGHMKTALTMVTDHTRSVKIQLRFVEAVVAHGSDADVEAVLDRYLSPGDALPEALAALVGRAPAGTLPRVRAAVGRIPSGLSASLVTHALARRLLDTGQPEESLEVLMRAALGTFVGPTAEAAAEVLPHVRGEALTGALDWLGLLARRIHDAELAERLAQALPADLAEDLFDRLRDGDAPQTRQHDRGRAAAWIVAALPTPRRQEAAQELWAELEAEPRTTDDHASAILSLLRLLPDAQQDAAVARLLHRADETPSGLFVDGGRVDSLLPFLPDDDLDEAVEHVVRTWSTHEWTVAALDARLAESGRAGLLHDRLLRLPWRLRTAFLLGLSQRAEHEAAREMLREALRQVQHIGDEETVLTSMAETARQATATRRPRLLARCLSACLRAPTAALESEDVLEALAPQLGSADREDLLVRAVAHWEARRPSDGRVLRTAFRLMAGHGHARLALDHLATPSLGHGWAAAFCGAVPSLPEALIPEAHALVGRRPADDTPSAYLDVLLTLTGRVPAAERGPLVDELLEALPSLQPAEFAAALLAELTDVSPEQRTAIARHVMAEERLWRESRALVHLDAGELLALIPRALRLPSDQAELALGAVAMRLHILGETSSAVGFLRAHLPDAAFCRTAAFLPPTADGAHLTGVVRAVLDCAPHPDRDRALRVLAPHADTASWERLRGELPSLDGENRAFLLAEAARRSARAEAERWAVAGLDQAEALVPDSPHGRHVCVPLLDRLKDVLPPGAVVDKALPLLTTHPAPDDASRHRETFRTLVTPLPPQLQLVAAQDLLTACQVKPRAETLAWIGALLPVLTTLGGPDTPERLFDVVERVATAWP
ncbi:hypothetical protein [Streptomyces sp. BK239]|uniref:hypothetical protein n=1 Tax=Streptomyces sp. BK239 TaxID=2512155 RepID=UPI00102CBA07|nr:hypothetical protein [Streptomyces sp. BK239]RZU23546.1 hypothetical protein EV567_1278 [Streptomyces sp. BK239]